MNTKKEKVQPIINGSFDDIIKASVSGNPKPNPKPKKKIAKKKK